MGRESYADKVSTYQTHCLEYNVIFSEKYVIPAFSPLILM